MTDLLPKALLTDLRRLNDANLKSQALVQEEITESGPGGSSVKRWINRGNSLKCRVGTPNTADAERLQAMQIEARNIITVVFTAGADVKVTDRFVITMVTGQLITAYPLGIPIRDGEALRKTLCEVRG